MKDVLKSVLITINIVILITIFFANIICLLIGNYSYKNLVISQTIFIAGLNIITLISWKIESRKQ